MAGHVGEDPPQSTLIAQSLGEGLGLAQVFEDRPAVSECKERIAQVEPEIDGLLNDVTTFREMLQSAQRLLEARHRLAIDGTRLRPGARLPIVAERFIPALPPEGMLGQ